MINLLVSSITVCKVEKIQSLNWRLLCWYSKQTLNSFCVLLDIMSLTRLVLRNFITNEEFFYYLAYRIGPNSGDHRGRLYWGGVHDYQGQCGIYRVTLILMTGYFNITNCRYLHLISLDYRHCKSKFYPLVILLQGAEYGSYGHHLAHK